MIITYTRRRLKSHFHMTNANERYFLGIHYSLTKGRPESFTFSPIVSYQQEEGCGY